MKNNKQKFWISTSLILNIILIGTLIVARADSVPKLSQSPPMENVVIDGIINETEWADRDWTILFNLDVDDVGNPPDKDGTNYLYLGEDLNNLFIGLDLCSDQTNNVTNEWISLWLNIANRSYDNYEDWAKYLNNGTEALIYDVGNDKSWQFFNYGLFDNQQVGVNGDDEYKVIHGSVEGNYTLLQISTPDFNVYPVKTGSDYIAQVDFSVDILKWFPVLPGILANNVDRVRFQLYSSTNTSITENKIIVWYPNGTWNKNDPDQTNSINKDPVFMSEWFWYDRGNITYDRKLNFTLFANHSAPFTIRLGFFTFSVVHYLIHVPHSSVSYPYSSLFDFNMAWGFNISANNGVNHRMFEFEIPKSSLEHFDSDHDIGIMVGGYGTLSFVNSSYWVFSKYIHEITEEQSDDYYYYNMLGIDVPIIDGKNAINGYYILLIIGITGLCSVILIRKNFKLI
ncbi:MAG: hypothetical protein ACFFEO_17755 [Candidatus Thorarchaeota archaeon]